MIKIMKTEKMSFAKVSKEMTREEMRKIMAGSTNPNCGGSAVISYYYCCNGETGAATGLGNMTCDQASDRCDGYMVTTDSSRCQA